MFQKHFPSARLFPKGNSDALTVTRTGVNALVGASLLGSVGGALNRL